MESSCKKLAAFGLALGLFLYLVAPALAAGTTTYELDALDMSIEIPDDYCVFTRDMPDDDLRYAQFGFSKEDLGDILEESNIYLDALLPDVSNEIMVTMVDSPVEDFAQFSDTTLTAFASTLWDTAEDYGVTYIKSEIYPHEQVKFIKIYTSRLDNDWTVYVLQYYTVCNGQAISIMMQSRAGEITQANEEDLQKIVDSANFRGAKPVSEVEFETGPFVYTDAETGLSFTVPVNWSQAELLEGTETLDAKFVHTQEMGLGILYGSFDAWEEIPANERAGYSRTELDNSAFTAMDFSNAAKEWGVEDAKVSTVDYGDKMYFAIEGTCRSQVYGLDVSAPVFVLVRAENGYLFQFWFSGEFNSPYYSDFVNLVNSVQYPLKTADDFDMYIEPTAANKPASSGNTNIAIALICTVVFIVGCVAMFVFIWHKKAGSQRGFTEASDAGQDKVGIGFSEEDETQIVIRFCHRCGNKLVPGARFCDRCGAEIPDVSER